MSNILNLIRPVLGTDGNVTYTSLYKFPINKGAKKKFALGKEDYIKVSFSTHHELSLKIGDGIDDDGIGIYKLSKIYKPVYDEKTESYKYDLQLDAYYILWANVKMIYNPSVSAGELAFGLTGRLDLHAELLKGNLKANGFKYRGLDFVTIIDTNNVKNEAKLVECDGTDIISYLNTLCDENHFNCEWWVIQNKIYFGKCEFDNDNATELGYLNDVSFEIGKNCNAMKANDSKDEFANRIYVFGGTNNITGRYRKNLIYTASNVSDYKTGQKLIKDSSRPLFARYFKDSEKSQISYSLNKTLYCSVSNRIDQADFEIDAYSYPCGGYFDISSIRITPTLRDKNGAVVQASSDMKFESYVNVTGHNSISDKGAEVIGYSQKTDSISNGTMSLDSFSVSDNDVLGLVNFKHSVYIYIDIDYETYKNTIGTVEFNVTGSIIFNPSRPKINTKLKYNGTEYDVLINPDMKSSTDMEILLPAGLSMSVLDNYTLPHILSGRIPASQFTASEGENNDDLVYQGTVQKRLMLPAGTPYIQMDNTLTPEQIKVAILTYDDIYPRFDGQKITSVSSVDYENPDSDGDIIEKYPLFTIGDSALVFDENSIMDDTTPKIKFQTGNLAGNSFKVDFNGIVNGESRFVIKHDKDLDLPNSILCPTVGDEYVLDNIDPAYYFTDGAGTLEDKAEQELLEQGEKDAKDILNIDDVFDCTMKGDVIKKSSISYLVGQKVTLVNSAFFSAGTRVSRVIGYEINLDKPFDAPVYSIGNSVKYSLIADLESKIEKVKYNGNTYYYGGSTSGTSGVSSIYVVNKSDSTKLSDTNVMSSLKTIEEIEDRIESNALSKNHDDSTKYSLGVGKDLTVVGNSSIDGDSSIKGNQNIIGNSDVGGNNTIHGDQTVDGSNTVNGRSTLKDDLTVGQYTSGIGGSGSKIDKYGNSEMESLTIRRFLEVPEIRFNRTTYVQGDTIQSCAGGQIKSITIEKDSNGNDSNTGTIELRLEDNDIGEFDVDDICISIFCNLLDSSQNAVLTVDDGLGNRTVKGFATSMFRITSVSGERNEILTYSLRGISDRWTTSYHPQPLSTIAQRGNFIKVERQSLNISGIFPKPYLRIMHDVNYWEFSASMIGCQFGNMENLAILGINMTGYSAYLNNIYMNGTISQFESIEPKMTFNGGGDNQIAEGQTKLMQATITNGYGMDITDRYPYWKITRDTGDVAADNIWNAQATIENGEFYLTNSATVDDLGGKESALYTVTASDGISNPVTETISL